MEMNEHEKRVFGFFQSHPGQCVADLERSVQPEDFADGQAYRNFCKTSHSAANALWKEGLLTRVMKVDPFIGQDVWHYTVPAVPGQRIVETPRGYKAKYEALLAEFEEYKTEKQEQVDLLIIQRDKARNILTAEQKLAIGL
jgi:hypothetical protein